MLKLRNITGKKTAKGFEEDAVIASPTQGEFKVTPSIQKLFGIKDGDCMLTLVDEDEVSGKVTVYVGKGRSGEAILDDDGNKQYDERGRVVIVEGSDFGAIVRPAAANSPLLAFTASMAWKQAGASTEFNTYFSVGEPVEAEVLENEEDENSATFVGTFYPLTFDKKIAKLARKSKGESDEEEGEGDDENATPDASENVSSNPVTDTETPEEGETFQEEEI